MNTTWKAAIITGKNGKPVWAVVNGSGGCMVPTRNSMRAVENLAAWLNKQREIVPVEGACKWIQDTLNG